MKKKIVAFLLMTGMMMSVSACGKEPETKAEILQEITQESSQESIKEEVEKEVAEKPMNEEIELPNWVGLSDYCGYVLDAGGRIGVDICFPSLRPSTIGNWAYQMDPSLVLVTSSGYAADGSDIKADTLADTFEVSKEQIIDRIGYFRGRGSSYSDFDFVVESSEAVTINELSMYKYTGKHTYTLDGVAQEIPFVAYSFDTEQSEGSYMTLIVMDDSINNTSMDPLPEGTIEAYAKKMAESIKVKTSLF